MSLSTNHHQLDATTQRLVNASNAALQLLESTQPNPEDWALVAKHNEVKHMLRVAILNTGTTPYGVK